MFRRFNQMIRACSASIVNNRRFDIFIVAVIIFNSILIGVQTLPLPIEVASALEYLDTTCLLIYIIEIVLRFISNPKAYFKSGWNIFDFTIVLLSVLPNLIPFPIQMARILRVFRTLRVLLLISAFEPLRRIIVSLVRSLPSIAWTAILLCIFCYLYGIAGFYLYGESFPEYFGSLGTTFFTLFQLTTLENWAEIARDVMALQPASAIYFISFILVSAFIIVNVVVGIIVSSIEETARSGCEK